MLIISQDIQKRMSQRNTKRSLYFEVLTVTNSKGRFRINKFGQYSQGDYILCMTSRYLLPFLHQCHITVRLHWCVYHRILMTWRHDKVVRKRTSRATSRHSFITTVWWYNILYHTPCIGKATSVNFKGKRT